jgi:hypothetical protein
MGKTLQSLRFLSLKFLCQVLGRASERERDRERERVIEKREPMRSWKKKYDGLIS